MFLLHNSLLLVNCFLRPGFLEAEGPGKVGVEELWQEKISETKESVQLGHAEKIRSRWSRDVLPMRLSLVVLLLSQPL